MRKIYLLIAVTVLSFSVNSCSTESGDGNRLSFKVDGVLKKFKTNAEEVDGHLYVSGYIGNLGGPTEEVFLDIVLNGAGMDYVNDFGYYNANGDYHSPTLLSDVTINNGGKATGTFSGTLEQFGSESQAELTEGNFSVNY